MSDEKLWDESPTSRHIEFLFISKKNFQFFKKLLVDAMQGYLETLDIPAEFLDIHDATPNTLLFLRFN